MSEYLRDHFRAFHPKQVGPYSLSNHIDMTWNSYLDAWLMVDHGEPTRMVYPL
jgi:hypothetical protein